MKSLLWLLAVFAAAVALVIVGRLDAGVVLVVFPPYRIEASLLFVAIVAIVTGVEGQKVLEIAYKRRK